MGQGLSLLDCYDLLLLYAFLMEEPVLDEVFLYCVYFARKERLRELRRHYELGDIAPVEKSADDFLSSQNLRICEPQPFAAQAPPKRD